MVQILGKVCTQVNREVPPRGQKGEEEYLPGCLPPATSTLLPLYSLGGRAAGSGGNSYPEKNSQSPGHQVAASLLKDVWIRQE